jgi:hypothetical protein
MRQGDELKEFIMKLQTACDDASMDFAYIGAASEEAKEEGGFSVDYNEESEITEDKSEIIAYAVETAVKIHRANGGVGRGTIRAKLDDVGLEVEYKFIKSLQEAFEYIR